MTPSPISREKLLSTLKALRVCTEEMDDTLFLYGVGRNGVLDYLLVEVMSGGMDEVKEGDGRYVP